LTRSKLNQFKFSTRRSHSELGARVRPRSLEVGLAAIMRKEKQILRLEIASVVARRRHTLNSVQSSNALENMMRLDGQKPCNLPGFDRRRCCETGWHPKRRGLDREGIHTARAPFLVFSEAGMRGSRPGFFMCNQTRVKAIVCDAYQMRSSIIHRLS
jgi:hypothetical protein